MRIVDIVNGVDEIISTIKSKALYQNVLICMDQDSNTELIDEIIAGVGDKANIIKYYYNTNSIKTFYNMANNGVRVVIYNVSLTHFYKLQIVNSYVVSIFVAQSNFLLPYAINSQCVYGENLLICDMTKKDYTSLIYVYYLAFNKVWSDLLQGEYVDGGVFSRIDRIANNLIDFCPNLINQIDILRYEIDTMYQEVSENEICYYLYLRLFAILKMLKSVEDGDVQYVDFYKTESSAEQVDKAYNLLIKNDTISILKNNISNLIKLANVVLDRIKIIIKKYYKNKQIKINKINSKIKNWAKSLKENNLLFIAYILNSI